MAAPNPPAPACSARSARLPVVHSALSLLHKPKHEILSGQLQDYFETPKRYNLILDALLADRQDGQRSPMQGVACTWAKEDVGEDWVLDAINKVHKEEYLVFLRTVYDEWVVEGGSKVSPACEPATTPPLRRRLSPR